MNQKITWDHLILFLEPEVTKVQVDGKGIDWGSFLETPPQKNYLCKFPEVRWVGVF